MQNSSHNLQHDEVSVELLLNAEFPAPSKKDVAIADVGVLAVVCCAWFWRRGSATLVAQGLLAGRQELWHEIAAMAVARSVADLHPVGGSNSDKLVFYFLSKLQGGAGTGFFFCFFGHFARVAIIHKYI
jgi:hypothetical protein